MGKWLRVDALHSQHAKFDEMGHWGWSIVNAAWCLAKAFDLSDGDITQYWRPKALAKWSLLDQIDGGLKFAAIGMKAALDMGLVEEKDGRFYIHDWEEYQRDRTAAERKRRQREKQKGDNGQNKSRFAKAIVAEDLSAGFDKYPTDYPGWKIVHEWQAAIVAACKKPQTQKSTKARLETQIPGWLKNLRLLHDTDGHPWEDITLLVRWVIQDTPEKYDTPNWNGWFLNCKSPAKLREKCKKADGEPYFDVIWRRMEMAKKPHGRKRGEQQIDPSTWKEQVEREGSPYEDADGPNDD